MTSRCYKKHTVHINHVISGEVNGGGKAIFSHGDTSSAGVAILFNKNLNVKVLVLH